MCLLLALLAPAHAAPPVDIALVSDGGGPQSAALVATFGAELAALLEPGVELRLHPSAGDQTEAGVAAALDLALADPELELVIALGPIASQLAGQRQPARPLIAPFVIDPELQGLPREGLGSGVPQLNYLALPSSVSRDMQALRGLVEVERVAMLVHAPLLEALPQELLDGYRSVEGVTLTPVPVTDDPSAALAALPADTQAVYLGGLPGFSPEAQEALLIGITEKGLPSFALTGAPLVARGALAGLGAEDVVERLARQVALHAQLILDGEAPGSLPTVVNARERLSLNLDTARALGISPPWSLLSEAQLFGGAPPEQGLGLSELIDEALAANLDLLAEDQRVEAAAADVRLARARLLPQVEVQATGAAIDPDLSRVTLGILPQYSVKGAGTLTQVLWAEPALAAMAISAHLEEAAKLGYAQLSADTALSAAQLFYAVHRAREVERAMREDLEITRAHRALAEMRVGIGASSRADLYRWDAEIALSLQRVVDARTQRQQAEVALNQVLHRPLGAPTALAQVTASSQEVMAFGATAGYADNPAGFEALVQGLIADGLARAPELARLDEGIAAQERLLLSARRASWSPTVALQAESTMTLWRTGVSAEFITLAAELPEIEAPDPLLWQAGVAATLPLYAGGQRAAELDQTAAELAALQRQRDAAAARIEQWIRSAALTANASWLELELTRRAAEAAGHNLELVGQAYAAGAVSIVELLDAQDAALQARLGAADARWSFLLDHLELLRAVNADPRAADLSAP
ncbi:MAG: TolC family protein [Alphaproteobacteria bacterium]|nr:TolC family protein [Alphaproteobacteria bacterium]